MFQSTFTEACLNDLSKKNSEQVDILYHFKLAFYLAKNSFMFEFKTHCRPQVYFGSTTNGILQFLTRTKSRPNFDK